VPQSRSQELCEAMKSGRHVGCCEDSTVTVLSYVLRARPAILTLLRECGNGEGEGEGEGKRESNKRI
jgi:hypothetical protein